MGTESMPGRHILNEGYLLDSVFYSYGGGQWLGIFLVLNSGIYISAATTDHLENSHKEPVMGIVEQILLLQ